MQRISEQEAQELIRGNRGFGRTSSRYTQSFWDQVFCGEPVILWQDGRKAAERRDFDMKATSFVALVYKENLRRRAADPETHGDYSVHRIKIGGKVMEDRILVCPKTPAA